MPKPNGENKRLRHAGACLEAEESCRSVSIGGFPCSEGDDRLEWLTAGGSLRCSCKCIQEQAGKGLL